MESLWTEFVTVRAKARDLKAYVKWYGRKRDEAQTPEDYVYYAHQCNATIREMSECVRRENELHFEITSAISPPVVNVSPPLSPYREDVGPYADAMTTSETI